MRQQAPTGPPKRLGMAAHRHSPRRAAGGPLGALCGLLARARLAVCPQLVGQRPAAPPRRQASARQLGPVLQAAAQCRGAFLYNPTEGSSMEPQTAALTHHAVVDLTVRLDVRWQDGNLQPADKLAQCMVTDWADDVIDGSEYSLAMQRPSDAEPYSTYVVTVDDPNGVTATVRHAE